MSEKLALLGGTKTVDMAEEFEAANRWPIIGEEEMAAVNAAMRDPDIYAPISMFEKEFAAYTGAQYAVATCNGSSAIQSAYFAVGVQPGDEVICPSYTWHLGVSQVLTLHAIPVFCDIDPKTACISVEDLKRKISPYTRAISVVHPYGAVSPMDEIMEIAREHGIKVIEDCSHAHGARYRGRHVGTIGDVGCFSLQAGKMMVAVEGGIMITNDEECYERAIVLGHYERIPSLKSERYRKYVPAYPGTPACFGYKYRMHPWAAACARVQLDHLEERNAIRRRNLEYMTNGLSGISDGLEPPFEAPGTHRTWLNFVCQYYEEKMGGVPRDRFVEALNAEGLPSSSGRAGYLPVYWNPLYEERNMWGEGCPFDSPYTHRKVEYTRGICPEAESFWLRTVGLPAFPNACDTALLDQSIEAVAKVIRNLDQLRP